MIKETSLLEVEKAFRNARPETCRTLLSSAVIGMSATHNVNEILAVLIDSALALTNAGLIADPADSRLTRFTEALGNALNALAGQDEGDAPSSRDMQLFAALSYCPKCRKAPNVYRQVVSQPTPGAAVTLTIACPTGCLATPPLSSPSLVNGAWERLVKGWKP